MKQQYKIENVKENINHKVNTYKCLRCNNKWNSAKIYSICPRCKSFNLSINGEEI